MDVKEQLDEHVNNTYDDEVYCMCPVGMESAVLGTEMTNDEAAFTSCDACGSRRRLYPEEVEDFELTAFCVPCDADTPQSLEQLPIVRCVLSEGKVLELLKERISRENPEMTEQALADEVMSEYCHNTTGGYYGPETPIFIDEFTKE